MGMPKPSPLVKRFGATCKAPQCFTTWFTHRAPPLGSVGDNPEATDASTGWTCWCNKEQHHFAYGVIATMFQSKRCDVLPKLL
jgi:hypothetical protein